MKTNFVKITAIGFLLFIALLVNTKPADAQQEKQSYMQQKEQLAEQGNYHIEQQKEFAHQHNELQSQKWQHGEQRKNIEAQKIAFITQELNLTPDEAKVFWPVYNEYDTKRHELKKLFRGNDDARKVDIEKLTDAEATQILDNQIIEAQKLLDLRKEYHAKFKTVLPPVKVLKLYDTEREFQKILIDKLRQKKQSPPGNRR